MRVSASIVVLSTLFSIFRWSSSFYRVNQLLSRHTSGFLLMNYDRTGPVHLERMVERKKVEVENLLRRHQEPDDPLVMRMSYMASECRFNVTRSIRKDIILRENPQKLHTMSVIVDMKRRSPTVPQKRNIVEFGEDRSATPGSGAAKFGELLTVAGADAFFVNIDEMEYGGKLADLKETSRQLRTLPRNPPPACIAKDLIIHPVQIAQALENGAAGVLLIVAVVGGDLEILLDACTIMGTEAIVEVHTPNELEFALTKGATMFLVNMWDRATGELFPEQAKGMASMLPMNSVAIAAGNIHSIDQVAELGFYGYDSVVLGRNLAEIADVRKFCADVHSFRGLPRMQGGVLGMKGMPYQ